MGLALSCCDDDNPVNPPPPEYGEHLFYVSARLPDSQSLVKTFSVEQDAFIDSFIVDSFPIDYMAVAENDERLFLVGPGMRVYDLDTKELLCSTTDYCCGLHISNNSAYYASGGYGIRLFRTDNYQQIYYDSGSSAFGDFSFDSRYYLYTSSHTIMTYNIRGDSIESSFGLTRNGSLFRVYGLWPTNDMEKLFIYGNQGNTLYFAVTDLGGDSVRVLQAPLRTWGVDVEISPDGRYLFFVNTPYTDFEMPRMKIDVYDVATEQLLTSISTQEYYYFEPQHIALTADGKYLMATPWNLGGFDVLLIDARNFSVIGRYQFRDQIIPEIVCTK